MNAFRVWVRRLKSSSRVRVDGDQNTHWLLGRLSRAFIFKSSEPIRQDDAACCTFEVAYNSRLSSAAFERVLAAMPEVQLLREPA